MNCAVHSQTQAVAFCRTCGKALCEDCKRDVMGAIYCEPCIAARLHGSAVAPAVAAPPVTTIPGAPNPAVAGLLGLVPGVGAMYNGQFAKAFVHVLIFVLLILAANNISPLFGFGIGFFVLYMSFEAYKTAEAKRMGLPVPDPLGLDKMFGFQDAQQQPPATPTYAAPEASAPGTPAPGVPAVPTPAPQPLARDSVPVGAVVLMVMGVFFLLDNLGFLNIHRLWPLFLIGLGLWLAYKRSGSHWPGGPR